MSIFTQEEWRRNILPKLVKLCRAEALKAGHLGKRRTRASREYIIECVRRYTAEIVKKRLSQLTGDLDAEISRLKSELGLA